MLCELFNKIFTKKEIENMTIEQEAVSPEEYSLREKQKEMHEISLKIVNFKSQNNIDFFKFYIDVRRCLNRYALAYWLRYINQPLQNNQRPEDYFLSKERHSTEAERIVVKFLLYYDNVKLPKLIFEDNKDDTSTTEAP